LGFFGAAFYQWVNAKAWIVITSVTSTFTSTDGNMTLQVSLITLAFLVIGLPSNIIWLAGGHMISRLIKHVVFYRVFNVCMALLLAFSVVPLVLNGA
jgi:threonine/homoserine/homoserine lactone efflux protein